MDLFFKQLQLEELWQLMWLLACKWNLAVCAGHQMHMTIQLTDVQITIFLVLSLSGLLVWLGQLMRLLRFIYWFTVARRRQQTLEEILVEFKQEQDQAQRDYLLKLLGR